MYDYNEQSRHLHDQCKKHMEYHCLFSMADGSSFDGIILNVDVDNVTVLIGEDVMAREDGTEERQYGDYDGYGGYSGYGHPGRRRYRRFRRQVFPLAALAGLSLLPYTFPGYQPHYPYYPPYPYYPYY